MKKKKRSVTAAVYILVNHLSSLNINYLPVGDAEVRRGNERLIPSLITHEAMYIHVQL